MTIEEFEKQLRIKNSSDKTIQTYLKQIRPFLNFCEGDVSQDNIDKYLINRRESVSDSSFNLFINALKKYCEYSGYEFKIPKQKNIKTKYYNSWTLTDFKNDVLQYVYDEDDLILRFMFFTGCRPNELFRIKKQHINYKQEEVIIKDGKGGKDRIIPFLDEQLYKDLEVYIKSLEGDILFDYNEQRLQYMFRTLKEQLNLDEDICPYTMRRSFAKHCIKIGFNDSSIQVMMGHENIKTTMKYIQPDKQMVRDRWEFIKNGGNNPVLAKAYEIINNLKQIIKDLKEQLRKK